MNTQPTSIISNYVLQSFNLLDPVVAKDLKNIINHLIDIRGNKDKLGKHITVQMSQQSDQSRYHQEQSERKSYERVAGTFGVSGSYGFYSGSLKVSASNEKLQNSTSFSSSCIGTINIGNVYFNESISDIINFLDPDVVTQLKAINSLDAAKKFITNYGTHLATNWNLGGAFSLEILAATTSYDEKTSVEAEVTAAYKSVASVSASASAAYELNQSGASSNLSILKEVSGGSAKVAGSINLDEPNTGIDKWIATINSDSTYGLNTSVSFVDLAKAINQLDASNFLKDYVNLFMLQYSLENPTIFTSYEKCIPYNPTTVSAVSDKHFKIVAGGAKVDEVGSTWLMSTYPSLDSQGVINGWVSVSHDLGTPSTHEYITSYAMAVYDPGNFLETMVRQAKGTNTGVGADEATAKIDSDFLLVGGGCHSQINSGNLKYMMSSYPKDDQSWMSIISDYSNPASDTLLTSFAVGIKCEQLAITRNQIVQQTPNPVSHGNESAKLGNEKKVIGGGIFVQKEGPWGSLSKQTWPSDSQTWTEYNADLEGNVTQRIAKAFAIGLDVTIKGISK